MTIEICPRCGGEIRAKAHTENGNTVISGMCYNCGRLLAYSPNTNRERPQKAEPAGEVRGWVLRIWDEDRGWRSRRYELKEEELLHKHVTELESRGQAYEFTEVRA